MSHDPDMVQIAKRAAEELGFEPAAPQQIDPVGNRDPGANATDLRELPWSSIDNEESRDLDQIEWAEGLPGGAIRVLLGIADVAAYVPRDSEVDRHARVNTVTLYTGVKTFHMLPKALSTQRTSLLEGEERLAMVTEMVIREDGTLDDAKTLVYPARVRNHAKLIYEEVGAWLEGDASAREPNKTFAEQLRLHDEATRRLRTRRQENGALELETVEARTVAKNGRVVDLELMHKNRARDLVEDLMIAANGATARFLETRGYSSIRRVVHAPSRWNRIVDIARGFGGELPAEPDVRSLGHFVATQRRTLDRDAFTDLSLTIVKLLGPGEYLLQRATDPDTGHFGLAVDDYMHSTAPNRRYPDLVTQRILKAAAVGATAPYTDTELEAIATHCTERENAARKLERTMRKAAAASLLSHRIGEVFKAIVTGVKQGNVYARLVRPPAEGKVVENAQGLDVGDRIFVRLLDTNVEKGFIDLASVETANG
jgi:VacB/RNase II family 3'-5' exoribonuclease